VADYCEHCNGTLCSVRDGEFLDWLNDCWFLKVYVTWSQKLHEYNIHYPLSDVFDINDVPKVAPVFLVIILILLPR
jgi:hypothetical protein